MKKQLPVIAFALTAAVLLASSSPLAAQFFTNSSGFHGGAVNFVALEPLVAEMLPRDQFFESCSGSFYSLANRTGDQIQINLSQPDEPRPVTNTIGYLDSPVMNYLARQKMPAATDTQAADAAELYLSLARGVDFTRANHCHARRFDDCWVVTVEHDFTNHPGNILATMPFELQVDSHSSIVQFRERIFNYPGSAAVYSNTLAATYRREKNNFPAAVDHDLESAWKKEQRQLAK